MKYIISQIFAAIAFCAILISFQKKKKKDLLTYQMVENISDIVHYSLLGGITGIFSSSILLARNAWVYKFEKVNRVLMLTIFELIILVSAYINWNGIISVLPLIGNAFYTYAVFKPNTKTIRLLSCITSICWIIYNIAFKSAVGTLSEIILFISIQVAIYRLDIKKKN